MSPVARLFFIYPNLLFPFSRSSIQYFETVPIANHTLKQIYASQIGNESLDVVVNINTLWIGVDVHRMILNRKTSHDYR